MHNMRYAYNDVSHIIYIERGYFPGHKFKSKYRFVLHIMTIEIVY